MTRPLEDRGSRELAAQPEPVPASLAQAVRGYEWARDTIGEAGATVHRLSAQGRPSLYLKHGTGEVADEIVAEMERLRWLGRYVMTPQVQGFVFLPGEAWLLMTAVPGRTAYQVLESEPDRRVETVRAIAEHLRTLHAVPSELCPFNSAHPLRLARAKARMDAGAVDADDFDEAHEGWTPEEVWEQMNDLLPIAADPVITHGDYSLDNILLDGGRVSGLIDLGRVGVADRYQDLAILWSCLSEFGPGLQGELFVAYGVNKPDLGKVRFYLALDEFF